MFKTYSGIIWLLCGITVGSILGLVFGKEVEIIKPLGDIFLNLLFTTIIPLIFFTGPHTLLLALGITVIVSVVEGGVPNGGYIGEILAITIYGFPMEQALPAAMIVGTLVDSMATLLNVNGDVNYAYFGRKRMAFS